MFCIHNFISLLLCCRSSPIGVHIIINHHFSYLLNSYYLCSMKVLLINPPLSQVNTPYPAVCRLTAFLNQQGISTHQADLSIEFIDRIFKQDALHQLFDAIEALPKVSRRNRILLGQRAFFIQHMPAILSFLRGADLTLATRFARPEFWQETIGEIDPEAMEWAYGISGTIDQAKYLATRALKALVELIRSTIHPHFELIRYAESLSLRLPTFDALQEELSKPLTLMDNWMIELLEAHLSEHQPQWVGFSVTFPGNLYAALRCAQYLRSHHPHIQIVMGGGYVNTELRQLSDTTLFQYVHYLTFDDGELPLLRLIKGGPLLRTAYLQDGEVQFAEMDSRENIPFAQWPAPTWQGLPQHLYFDLVETTNPMHRLWSVGRWNKLMLAHGCYWAKCTFCDTTLPYIAHYEQAPAALLVDHMEQLMAESGISGFHFTDEAAPPAVLKAVAQEIIGRKLTVSYWTNIRFDKTFTPELAFLLAKSGCIAVSGGLEVASDRVLRLINKGVSLQSARTCMENLSAQGIMVHTYLMYGFPTQQVSELYQSLEVVRDLFADGLVQSAFWHRYAMTVHSPSGQMPQSVGAKHLPCQQGTFANNEIPFTTQPDISWERYHDGLQLATYNYMQGTGFELPIKEWFKSK